MACGRPTKYEPKFCKMLVDHMASGLSFESFGPTIGVHRDTLYQWEKVHPAFSDAKKLGVDSSLLLWEKAGLEGMWDTTEYENGRPIFKKSLNASVWIFNLKNKHKWVDKPIETQAQPDTPETKQTEKMTDEELDKTLGS